MHFDSLTQVTQPIGIYNLIKKINRNLTTMIGLRDEIYQKIWIQASAMPLIEAWLM